MTDLRQKLQKILNRETIAYVLVGFATTAVDYIVFALVNELMKMGGCTVALSSSAATVVGWAAAVLFAFITNKRFVFQSTDWSAARLFREIASFFSARLVSGLIVLVLMRVLVAIGMNEYVAKLLTSAFNLVFNYVASKLFIFKK